MKREMIRMGLVMALLCLSGRVAAQDTLIMYKKPLVPNYINTQFAGNIGMGSVGAGYRMNKKRTIEWVFGFGYTPQHEAARKIFNLSFRTVYLPVSWNIGQNSYLFPQLTLGVSRQFASGNKTFVTLPNTYPDGYYAPNAFRAHFSIGGRLRKELKPGFFFEAIEFYAETTTNDLYLTYYYKSRTVRLTSIFSMALGVNLVMYNLKSPGIIVKKSRG